MAKQAKPDKRKEARPQSNGQATGLKRLPCTTALKRPPPTTGLERLPDRRKEAKPQSDRQANDRTRLPFTVGLGSGNNQAAVHA